MNLEARVRRTIQRHSLASADSRILVAVSGGSDSVALLYLLHALHRAGELQIAGLAHFNHQLREAADGDARYCAGLAHAFGLPLVEGAEDVRRLARHERRSLEDAARKARHAF